MSESIEVDLYMEQGTDFALAIVLLDEEGRPEDLTGLRVIAQIRPSRPDSASLPLIELNTDNGRVLVNEQPGEVLFSLSDGSTRTLETSHYSDGFYHAEWSAVLVDANGNHSALAGGDVFIAPEGVKNSTLGSASLPVADFTWTPAVPVVGNAATFNATTSAAVSGSTITAYEWDFDDNGSFETSGSTPTHSFPTTGRHRVRLRVTDSSARTQTTTGWVLVS